MSETANPLSLYRRLNPNEVLVLLNNDGTVVDAVYQPLIYSNALDDIRNLLKPGTQIRRLFEVPQKRQLDTLAAPVDNPEAVVVEYPNCRGVFNFEGAQEEFHSLLPTARLRLLAVREAQVLGVVRLSNFFARLSTVLHRQPIFCTDKEDRIVGYNRAFGLAFPERAGASGALLNLPLSDLMNPTPTALQQTETENLRLPPEDEWARLFSLDMHSGRTAWLKHLSNGILESDPFGFRWKAEETRPSLLAFPDSLEPSTRDIRLRLEIGPESRLPCFLLGENSGIREEYTPDLDGYLLGPDVKHSLLTLKKQGDTAYINTEPLVKDPAGTLEFLKVGLTFMVLHNGRRLFLFHDFEGLAKKECRAFLYLRAHESLRLRKVELSTRLRERPLSILNRFVRLSNSRNQQCIIERLPANAGTGLALRCSIFLLRDMSDVRKTMDDLEQNYRKAVEREKEAVQVLQEVRGSADFIGAGKSILQVKTLAEKAAATSATLLIQGETGTGKEVLARFIHGRSPQAQGPFTHVDCSTIPPSLLESMLFGHEKGAFTGAIGANPGLFQQASGGTLFLDEIHNISLEVQAKLLRFLEDHTITPIGGQKAVNLDVRVILSTNVNLKEWVRDGRFREDLFYRMAVIELLLPPLRERREDIPSLAGHFLERFNRKYGKSIRSITPAAYRMLYEYDWPGNIRELRNVLERAYVFCEKDEINEELISLMEPAGTVAEKSGRVRRERKAGKPIRASRQEIIALLKKHHGYIRKLADELGVTRQTLYVFFRKAGIRPDDYR